ncbi:signal transduction histidine kinase [Pseudomonas citronellolis]|nr:ATP-binding protein [Pseudomonas citronellolis]MCP1642031.1 signal transduction histidine kinase [Pseudomonas citronellolis]MCP1702785.1 signal transduction histidine kinase [Pseudomonas citronellolis]
MKTLGEELISSDSVALIELVKNAYDADASEVLIKFTGPLGEGTGSVQVIDNGKGMDLEVVRGAWMEPATPSKVKEKESKRGRRVLGEKGIGRFAASRLASMLELSSKRLSEDQEVYALFDWTQFDDEEKYLDEIEVHLEIRAPKDIADGGLVGLIPKNSNYLQDDRRQGTALVMTGMKRDWSSASFDDIQRGLSRLVSPFEELSDFRIKVIAPAGLEHYSTEIHAPELIRYPHYTVEGVVRADGTYSIEYSAIAEDYKRLAEGLFVVHPKSGWSMRDGGLVSELQENYQPPACGELKIQLRIWDRDELGNIQQKVGGTISNIRKDLDNIAGINIYRDGFRVMPYGEPNNDWMRLDLRRVQKPTYRLSNNQIVGYISITADGNPELRDQSNREGLRENQAYLDLKEIMMSLLSKMEDIRYKSRKGTGNRDKEASIGQRGLFDPVDLTKLREHISRELPSDVAARSIVDDIEADFASRISNLKQAVSRYSGLATLGKLVDAVLHEGRQPLALISGQAKLAQENLEDYGYSGKMELESSYEKLSVIREQSNSMSLIFKRIEPFGGRRSGRPPQLYMEDIITDAFKIFEGRLKEAGVSYDISDSQTLVRVDKYELQQIIINLLDNSIYWLQFVPAGSRRIAVGVSRSDDGSVEIIFSDSGPGVPEEDRGSIFDAYYSTRKDGAGLGLSIVGEMVSSYYGGSLELLDNGDLPGATFRIKLVKRV